MLRRARSVNGSHIDILVLAPVRRPLRLRRHLGDDLPGSSDLPFVCVVGHSPVLPDSRITGNEIRGVSVTTNPGGGLSRPPDVPGPGAGAEKPRPGLAAAGAAAQRCTVLAQESPQRAVVQILP